jgi:hypothetical protein
MSNLLKKAAKKNTGWNTTGQNQLYGSKRLNAELQSVLKGFKRKFSMIFGRDAGGISGRLLTLGELVREASGTRFGRLSTAGISLLFAWILLKHR